MVKSLYYGIGGILLFGVVIALFLLYNSIEKPAVSTNYKTNLQEKKEVQSKDFGWIKSLGEAKQLSFAYPVDELNINFTLSELTKPKKVIQLISDKVDTYQYFCIKQIFEQNSLNFSILKQEQKFVANIMDIDDATFDKIQKDLNYYEIDYKINTFYTKDY